MRLTYYESDRQDVDATASAQMLYRPNKNYKHYLFAYIYDVVDLFSFSVKFRILQVLSIDSNLQYQTLSILSTIFPLVR